MITQERAREIQTQATALATHGPWSDKIGEVLTLEEKKELNEYWATLPLSSSFMDAFFDYRNGTVGELG